MSELLIAFGRGCVKLLVSVFVGTGVGLITFGVAIRDKGDFWSMPNPPGEMFLAVGAGLLTTGALMMVLFWFPRLKLNQTHEERKPAPAQAWSEP